MTDAAAPLPPHRLVIGMECHVRLRTATKCFCACPVVSPADGPNRNVCAVCLALPGALPVLSREALVQAVRAGLGLGCTIAAETRWDRKNYFYPDLPKGWQITQVASPLCTDGSVRIESPSRGPVDVRVERAHLEEDTGKLVHLPGGTAVVDFGRAGVPLLEIVSRPDLATAAEASLYLEELRRIVRHLGVSDGDMEKGQLRCEPNVNVVIDAPEGPVATRIVELKNLNSFAHVRNAIEHERVRQVREWLATRDRGPRPRSTRGWDEARGATYVLRAKEEAADYRVFAEPDLPPVTCARRIADELRATLPELPRARRERYESAFGLAPAEAASVADDRSFAEWFDAAVAAACADDEARPVREVARAVASRAMTEVRREMNARGGDVRALPLSAGAFGRFVRAVLDGRLPREAAKTAVFPAMAATGREWAGVARDLGVSAAGEDAVAAACAAALAENPGIVESVRAGRESAKGALVGDAMRRLAGRADARRIRSEIDRQIERA